MDLSFFPLTLEAIDEAAAESLCLFIAADERPLTGLAGLADWRLSGKLSRLLRGGVVTGEAGEAVLTPGGSRLAFQKLFLFGVGPSGQSDEELAATVAGGLRKLAHAGVHEAALQLPARLSADAGIRTLLDELQGPGRALLFSADPQKLVAALSQVATRGQANVERRVVKVPGPAAPARPTPPGVKPYPPRATPPGTAPAIPKASPLPFAPQPGLPERQLTPTAIPKASPLPSAPTPPPAAGSPSDQTAPAQGAPPDSAPARPAEPADERRPALPPSQRYVPPPPKPHVFQSGKKKR